MGLTKWEVEIGREINEKEYNHAKKRLQSMSMKALINRVYKMTSLIKLEAFRQVCLDFGEYELEKLVIEKIEFLFSDK